MMSSGSNKSGNRIINIVVLAVFCAIILYCIVYVRNNREDFTKPEGYHVSIRGREDNAAEQTVQTTDPYENDFLPIGILTQCDGWTKEINLYVSEGICYAFLPAYAEQSGLAYVFDDTEYEVTLSGQALTSGNLLQDIEPNIDYEIRITDREQNVLDYKMVFLQSRNLPAVFIDTQSGSMDYVEAYKGNEESGQFYCVTADGEIDSSSAMSRIRGRGNTSWDGPGSKNQYNVRLDDYTDVLHMGSAQNWIIQGNRMDVSMMRNKLAYDFARDIGIPYAVDSEFADLYFNGRYAGTYLICEKIEVASDRVDIGTGYLLEENFRAASSESAFRTKRGAYLINHPEPVSEEEYEYISNYVNAAYESTANAGESDEYLNYIDLNSFAKLYIVDEIGNDPDNNALSTFYYKEDRTEHTKLTAGPVWDFDISFGNEDRCGEVLCSYYTEEWFEYLYTNETFRNEVAGQLRSFMDNNYDKYANHYFEDMEEYLRASYHMNEVRWKDKQGYIADFYSGYEENFGYLDDYFMTRLENLNAVFNGPVKMHKVDFMRGRLEYAHTFVPDGEVIPEQVLEHLRNMDGVVGWKLQNEQVINPYEYAIYDDVKIVRILPGEENPSILTDGMDDADLSYIGQNTNNRGEMAMQWITFIMLMVPGLISVWISGNTKIKKENAFAIISQYLVNSFVVILLAYGIFYVLYGSALLSFSGVYSTAYDYSIYNVNVTFKCLLLIGALSVAVGMAERIILMLLRKHKVNRK